MYNLDNISINLESLKNSMNFKKIFKKKPSKKIIILLITIIVIGVLFIIVLICFWDMKLKEIASLNSKYTSLQKKADEMKKERLQKKYEEIKKEVENIEFVTYEDPNCGFKIKHSDELKLYSSTGCQNYLYGPNVSSISIHVYKTSKNIDEEAKIYLQSLIAWPEDNNIIIENGPVEVANNPGYKIIYKKGKNKHIKYITIKNNNECIIDFTIDENYYPLYSDIFQQTIDSFEFI